MFFNSEKLDNGGDMGIYFYNMGICLIFVILCSDFRFGKLDLE